MHPKGSDTHELVPHTSLYHTQTAIVAERPIATDRSNQHTHLPFTAWEPPAVAYAFHCKLDCTTAAIATCVYRIDSMCCSWHRPPTLLQQRLAPSVSHPTSSSLLLRCAVLLCCGLAQQCLQRLDQKTARKEQFSDRITIPRLRRRGLPGTQTIQSHE